MKTLLNTLQVFTWAFLLHGCTRLHFPRRENLLDLKDDALNLNGIYKNLPSDTTKISMWNLFTFRDSKKANPKYRHANSYVQLIANDKKKLTAMLFVDSIQEAQILFKGKMKHNYFSIKRKIKYWGMPFIVGVHSDMKMQFAKDNYGNLVIDQAYSSMGWIFIMFAGVDNKGNYMFSTNWP